MTASFIPVAVAAFLPPLLILLPRSRSTDGFLLAPSPCSHPSPGWSFASPSDISDASVAPRCLPSSVAFSPKWWSSSSLRGARSDDEGGESQGGVDDDGAASPEREAASTPRPPRKYNLGLGRNRPITSSKVGDVGGDRNDIDDDLSASAKDSIEAASTNWIAPAPVAKPPSSSKAAPGGRKTTKYDLGAGKNLPLGGTDSIGDGRTGGSGGGGGGTTEMRTAILATNEEGAFLSRAVWDEDHFSGKNANGGKRRSKEETKRPRVTKVEEKKPAAAASGTTSAQEGNLEDIDIQAMVEGAVEGALRMVTKEEASITTTSTNIERPGETGGEDGASPSQTGQILVSASASEDVARDAGVSTSVGTGANIVASLPSMSAPTLRYEDIDLSIPPSVYCDGTDPNCEPVDLVWDLMRHEAKVEANREPLLVSFLYSTILNHRSLESALAFHLANRLSSPAMISTQINSLIREALDSDPTFRQCMRADVLAVRDRDPACTCLPDVFLYFKGFHALQTHRVAHFLWQSGRRVLAHYLQSQVSQNFQIDIHPNATFGSGIMLDHGTGIVVGETATVGHNCSILHHVTLGGSGKKGVDRHPKVGNGVLLGAGASVLGNIRIGDGCQVGAGTLVIGDLPSRSVAVGVPAKIIGSFVDVEAQPSLRMNQLGSKECDDTIVTFETEGI